MPVSVFDRAAKRADYLMRHYATTHNTEERVAMLREIKSIASEFAFYADQLDMFYEEEENRLVDTGKI